MQDGAGQVLGQDAHDVIDAGRRGRSDRLEPPLVSSFADLAGEAQIVADEIGCPASCSIPDAALWKTDIDGRGGGLRIATVGRVQGYRIGEAPVTGEISVTISLVDGGDFALRTTGPIQLVPAG